MKKRFVTKDNNGNLVELKGSAFYTLKDYMEWADIIDQFISGKSPESIADRYNMTAENVCDILRSELKRNKETKKQLSGGSYE